MDKNIIDLMNYRLDRAKEVYSVAYMLYQNGNYKDANNRSYYAAYYAMKALYTTRGQDFRKHKTLLANFNKEYVATEIFPRTLGRKISTLSIIREQSDYNDLYIASKQECADQLDIAMEVIRLIEDYLIQEGYISE